MTSPPPAHVIGDTHGQLGTLRAHLRAGAWIDAAGRWSGGQGRLWFLGDFTDRGDDGIGVIDLVMRLQREAAAVGGQVGAVFGNHDVLLVAAHRFAAQPTAGPGGSFRATWLRNGGQWSDLRRLSTPHIDWLTRLPAMARVDDHLLVHADAPFYADHGASIAAVNSAMAELLAGDDIQRWDDLMRRFGRRAFLDSDPHGAARLAAFLGRFGGRQLIHGHTPIPSVTGQPPEQVTAALVYAGGRCVNVDGGMYLGGPGFVHRLGLGSVADEGSQ